MQETRHCRVKTGWVTLIGTYLQMRNKDGEQDPPPPNSSKALPGERIQFQMTLHDEEGGLDDAISAKGN